MSRRQVIADEETPLLLPNNSNALEHRQKTETPIPWRQVCIILSLLLAEPLASQVIYPFAPELVRSLGIHDRNDAKVGYYVGILESLFFVAQALTIMHWTRLSDNIGRKPVLVIGLLCSSFSMCCFGLSKTFRGLTVCRFMAGAMNGNIGIIKTIMVELTDSTNVARAVAYQPLAWFVGATLGPLIGGSLSSPADKFALFRDSQFLRTYPYFLPCAVPATFCVIGSLVALFLFKETKPTRFSHLAFFGKLKTRLLLFGQKKVIGFDILDPSDDAPDTLGRNFMEENSVPFVSVLTPRVILTISNYGLLALVEISFRAIQPVFYATPIKSGGLGFTSETIGYCLGGLGVWNGVFQVLFFADINNRVGTKPLYLVGVCCGFATFGLFPVMSMLAKTWGIGWAVWVAIALQMILALSLYLCFSCMFIFMAAAAPDKRSVSTVNSIAQVVISIARAFGPTAVNSLFSLSIGHGYLGGLMVYYVMLMFVAISVVVGTMLPCEIQMRADN